MKTPGSLFFLCIYLLGWITDFCLSKIIVFLFFGQLFMFFNTVLFFIAGVPDLAIWCFMMFVQLSVWNFLYNLW